MGVLSSGGCFSDDIEPRRTSIRPLRDDLETLFSGRSHLGQDCHAIGTTFPDRDLGVGRAIDSIFQASGLAAMGRVALCRDKLLLTIAEGLLDNAVKNEEAQFHKDTGKMTEELYRCLAL
jgi:hypothetical protein